MIHVPGLIYRANYFLEEECKYLLCLIDKQPWRHDLKRRVQHYGYVYDYRKRLVDKSMYLGPLPAFLNELASMLAYEGSLSRKPDQVIVNEYLPGQGIAAHVDCVPCFKDQIATVSLGSEYEMEFISLKGKRFRTLRLEVGSLLILTGESRYNWMHRIAARKEDHGRPRGRRVSVTFRNVIIK